MFYIFRRICYFLSCLYIVFLISVVWFTSFVITENIKKKIKKKLSLQSIGMGYPCIYLILYCETLPIRIFSFIQNVYCYVFFYFVISSEIFKQNVVKKVYVPSKQIVSLITISCVCQVIKKYIKYFRYGNTIKIYLLCLSQ